MRSYQLIPLDWEDTYKFENWHCGDCRKFLDKPNNEQTYQLFDGNGNFLKVVCVNCADDYIEKESE